MANIIVEEFEAAAAIPEFESMENFLENGFFLTKNDRFSKFDIRLAPWTRHLARWVDDPKVKYIYLIMSSQVSKTTFMIAFLLYVSKYMRGPNPAGWYHHIDKELRKFVKKRLVPLIEGQPDFYMNSKDRFSQGGFQFFNSYLTLGSGSGKSTMAGDPLRWVAGDECGKWVESTSYAKLRTRTFSNMLNCCVFGSTPPETAEHHFIKECMAGNWYRYFVPCPHCGHRHDLQFSSMKFDGRKEHESVYSSDRIRKSARMICPKCDGEIRDHHKDEMINAVNASVECVDYHTGKPCEEIPSDTKTLHLSGLYSPFTAFGELASNFVTAKLSGHKAMINFLTDELGEFVKGEGAFSFKQSTFTRLVEVGRKRGQLIQGANIYTVGVDIQRKGDAYVTLYGYKSESTLISGHLVNFFVVKWKDEAGDPTAEHINKALEPYADVIVRGCVDATDGVVQDQIFDLCLLLGLAFLPLRDAGNQNHKFQMKTTSDMPSLDIYGKHKRFLGQQFISINSNLYKNEFSNSIARQEKGRWSFPSDTTKEFINHLGNEKRIEEKGRLIWKPKYSGAPQHFFSSTIYCFAAASLYRNQLYHQEKNKDNIRGNR